MLSTAKSRDLRSVRTASLEYIFLERYADLLSEKEADVSLSAEEFTMSKGGGGGGGLVEPGLQNASYLPSY